MQLLGWAILIILSMVSFWIGKKGYEIWEKDGMTMNIYQHYKGGIYYSIDVVYPLPKGFEFDHKYFAIHTETEEKIDIRMSKGSTGKLYALLKEPHVLYKDSDENMWIRPLSMFSSYVEIDGKHVERFKYIGQFNEGGW